MKQMEVSCVGGSLKQDVKTAVFKYVFAGLNPNPFITNSVVSRGSRDHHSVCISFLSCSVQCSLCNYIRFLLQLSFHIFLLQVYAQKFSSCVIH
jgi:adenine C2-methylase RlmN of 23S rRNA A2503 and tRNA A37